MEKERKFIREYNIVMQKEYEVIHNFLREKEKYDDYLYKFNSPIKMLGRNYEVVNITSMTIHDNDVVFYVDDYREYMYYDFAYSELTNVIDAIREKELSDAIRDIASMITENTALRTYWTKSMFVSEDTDVCQINFRQNGKLEVCIHKKNILSDFVEITEILNYDEIIRLRDLISIERLHRSNEYKQLMELLSLEPNLRSECPNYGDATFIIDGYTTFDITSLSRTDKGELVIWGNDIKADVCDNVELTEKDIKPEFLRSAIELIKHINSYMEFNGNPYSLNQCEGDIFEWYKNSSVGQYTNYYDKFIFHTSEGIEAAYKDDLSNYWKI